ncbi:MAG: hypothetical protein Rubg2KO_31600 [Rubricoccaceae bacterium]
MRFLSLAFLTLAVVGCDSQAPIEVQDIALRAEFLAGTGEVKATMYNRTDSSLIAWGCRNYVWFGLQKQLDEGWERPSSIIPIACLDPAYSTLLPDRSYVQATLFDSILLRPDPSPGTYRAYLLTGRDTKQLMSEPDTAFSEPFTVSVP